MDVLSDVFASLRVRGGLSARPRFCAPWGVVIPRCPYAAFHFVVSGPCCIRLEGADSSVSLERGDFVMLPLGDGYVMADRPTSRARAMDEVFGTLTAAEIERLVIGGGGEESVVICGAFYFERGTSHPLLRALPRLVHVHGRSDDSPHSSWLSATLALIAAEALTPQPGGREVIARALDVLFVQVLRNYLEHDAPGTSGWIAGLRDPHLARALGCLHEAPHRAWSVGSMAAAAGLSRSAFAARFTRVVGQPPLAYLAEYRMQRAAMLLRDKSLSVKEVARRVGYDSDQVFTRAFKRHVGTTPGAYRHASKTAGVS